jgi:hypothetical protein
MLRHGRDRHGSPRTLAGGRCRRAASVPRAVAGPVRVGLPSNDGSFCRRSAAEGCTAESTATDPLDGSPGAHVDNCSELAIDRGTWVVPLVRDEAQPASPGGRRLPLRSQHLASTERVKGACGVADAIGYADPGPAPLRPTLGSYEDDDSRNGHQTSRTQGAGSSPILLTTDARPCGCGPAYPRSRGFCRRSEGGAETHCERQVAPR